MEDLRQLWKRLHGVVVRKRAILFGAGLVALASSALGIILVLSVLAVLFVIPVPVKMLLLLCGMGMAGYALHRHLIGPLSRETGIVGAALQLEKKHPELKGRLVAALQFRDLDNYRTNFSPALIEMTGRQALEMTSGINFNEIVSGYPLFRKLRNGVGIGLLAVALGLLLPGFFTNAIEVYSRPMTEVAPPPGFTIEVSPGNAERVKYSDVEIGGRLIGAGFPRVVEVFYRFAEGRWQSEKIRINGDAKSVITGVDSLNGRYELPFQITLKQVRRSFDYYIVADDIRTAAYAINILERPRITDLKVTVNYPLYTGLEPMVLDEDNGSFAALIGSRAVIEIAANRKIDRGYLIINDSLKKEIDFDDGRGQVSLTIDDNLAYFIRLRDENGEENPDPIEYLVTAIPDEYPFIEVVFPGFDLNLDERMMIPFVLRVSDDFGFTSLALKYIVVSGGRKSDENVAIINLPENTTTEGEVSFNWDLDGFNLLPSDYVLYHFELADNDRVSGPKISRSRVYAARLPSIDEIVMESESEQASRVIESETVLKQQRQLVRRLEHLAQQLRNKERLEWQKKEELENIVDQQRRLSEQLENMSQQMKQSIEDMERNNLLSEQIFEKLMELQKLFSEVATPEMKEAVKRMQEALKQMSPEELEEAMKQFQLSQEEMLERLERTVELLKRMQIDQKMAAMLKMVEEMLLEQNRVNVDTEEARSADDYPRLTRREDQLQRQMEVLKNEAGKLEELLKESPFADSEDHYRFSEAVKQNQADADMAQMEEALSGKRQEAALMHGQDSSDKLSELAGQMRDIITSLAEDEGGQLAEQMRQAIDDANYLSHEQEKLHGQCQNRGLKSSSVADLAIQQQILREAITGLMQRVDQLAQRSPFLAAEILSYLRESMDDMSGACDNLGERRPGASLNQQQEAIYNLNRASVRLMDGLESQKQCNRGGSCNKPGMNLESICRKQNQINQETKGACPKPGQNPTPGQTETLKRLAGEQGSVRKSLQELQAEFGNRREILGRLDGLSREIEEIEELLSDGQAGQEVQNRQLRIYSRMLDLQKSLTRRDYTRERKATTAENILRASPGSLEDGTGQTMETLQDRLNRYLQESYPKQYEQQIKAYFKSISGMSQEKAADQ